MAEFSAGFKIFADASQFQREMRQSVESAKQVQRGLKDIGLNIGKFVGVTAVATWFTGTAKNAQELRDEIQKIGGTVDSATARVAAFGDGLDEIKKTAVGMSISVLGFFNMIGEALAWLPNRLTGVSKAQEELAAKTAKAAAEQEAQLKKSREANSPEKLAAAEKALQSERRKNLLENATAQERIALLLDEHAKIGKELDGIASNTVARKEKEIELEKITAEIRKAEADRSKEVLAGWDKQRKAATEDEEKLTKLNEQRTKLAQELADQAEREAAAKAKQLEIEQTLKKLNDASYADAINFMSGSTLDRTQVQSASSETLREIARRKQNNLQSLGAGGGSLAFDDNYFLRIQLQNEINQVKAELGLRESLSTNVAQRGIEGARRAFGGDPLVFDKLVQQFVTDARSADKINQENNRLLTDIRDRFKNGIPVVNLNSK